MNSLTNHAFLAKGPAGFLHGALHHSGLDLVNATMSFGAVCIPKQFAEPVSLFTGALLRIGAVDVKTPSVALLTLVVVVAFAIYLLLRRFVALRCNLRPFAGKEVTCPICLETGAETEIPLAKVTARCHGNRKVCVACLEQHIQTQVNDTQSDDISCLCGVDGCAQTLTYEDIRQHSSDYTFQLYDDTKLQVCLQRASNTDFVWCAHGCESGQMVDKEVYSFIMCSNDVVWHEGRTCEQYDRDIQEQQYTNDRTLQQHHHMNNVAMPSVLGMLSSLSWFFQPRTLFGDAQHEENAQSFRMMENAQSFRMMENDENIKKCPRCEIRLEKNGGW